MDLSNPMGTVNFIRCKSRRNQFLTLTTLNLETQVEQEEQEPHPLVEEEVEHNQILLQEEGAEGGHDVHD